MVARMAIGLVAIWLLGRASGEGAELERSGDALGAAGGCQLAGGGGRRGRHRGRRVGRGRRGRPARPRCSSRSGRPAARSDRRCSSAPMGHERGRPAVAVGPSGTVLLVWVDDDDPDSREQRIRPRRRLDARPAGSERRTTVMHGARMHGAPAASFDAGGVATVAWAEDDAGLCGAAAGERRVVVDSDAASDRPVERSARHARGRRER